MTLAAIAPLALSPVTITGIGNVRLKESDRIAAMEENLHALGGAPPNPAPDFLRALPAGPGTPTGRSIPHGDHRIAMCLLRTRAPGPRSRRRRPCLREPDLPTLLRPVGAHRTGNSLNWANRGKLATAPNVTQPGGRAWTTTARAGCPMRLRTAARRRERPVPACRHGGDRPSPRLTPARIVAASRRPDADVTRRRAAKPSMRRGNAGGFFRKLLPPPRRAAHADDVVAAAEVEVRGGDRPRRRGCWLVCRGCGLVLPAETGREARSLSRPHV